MVRKNLTNQFLARRRLRHLSLFTPEERRKQRSSQIENASAGSNAGSTGMSGNV